MKRLPISLQLYSMFGITIMLLLAVLGFTMYQFSTSSDAYEDLITHTSARTLSLSRAEDDFHKGISEIRALIAYSDVRFEEAALANYHKSFNTVKDIASTTRVKETKQEAVKLEKMLSEYIDGTNRFIQMRRSNDPGANAQLADLRNKTEQINKLFETVTNLQTKTMKLRTDELVKKHDMTEKLVLTLVSLIIAVVSGFVFWFSQNFAKRINNLRAELLTVSNFDLSTKDVHATRNDEIGDIAEAAVKMKQALRAIVRQLRQNAETLAASSEELSSTVADQLKASEMVADTAGQIAAGSEQNTKHITDMSATIQQISAGAQEMAASATQVNLSTQTAVNDANHGVELIQRVVSQNMTIEKTMGDISQISSSLVKGSSEIQEIVSVISTIAGQTNLLALNAAIEAARAGEAGRGFAVVAEEVRKLAEQSAQATSHIGSIIDRMTADISQAVKTVEHANKEVAAGKMVTAETQKGYQQIISKLNDVSNGIDHIAKAVNETSLGMQTIVSGIQNIGAVAEQTSASTQTVAAAAEEQNASLNEINANADSLSRMAVELNEITRKFKL